jgi:Spy/CpxP family protein refolding chaperone
MNNWNLKSTLITLIICASMMTAWSQPGQMKGERIKQLKIAFISEKLDLSVEEGQQFWPVFNEFEDKKESLDQQLRQEENAIGSKSSPNASDLEKAILSISELRRQEVSIHAEFVLDCLPILGPDKTRILIGIEKEFKKKLLEEIQARRQQNQGQRPGQRRK